jgi:glucokinase
MILAGDIGGTKCSLGLFVEEGLALRSLFQRRLSTKNYVGFEDLVGDFLEQSARVGGLRERRIEAAGFGLAGVVRDGSLHAGNLPWVLNMPALTRKLNLRKIILINDLTATALSLDRLPSNDLAILNQGVPEVRATKAVMAAGTGLGEAILFWDGKEYRVAPSEGGQADFAPRTEREIELLNYLNKQLPHVSSEDILSGRGFRRLHEFINHNVRHASFDGTSYDDAASEITQMALAQTCPVCVAALKMWTEIYGAEAGNLALRTLATGGIYLAGGIAPKILDRLKDSAFLSAFCGKSKLAPLLAQIPVFVVLNEDAPVWGAAYQTLISSRTGDASRAGERELPQTA